MPASVARRTAFGILLRIDRQAGRSDDLLHSSRLERLQARERALVTELVMGCLRRRAELDRALAEGLDRPVDRLDPEVLAALRLGAYQLLHMNNIPAHAAVSESVELVKGAAKRSASGLVNAVLRRVRPAPAGNGSERINHPAWLVRRWEQALGPDRCSKLLEANLRKPDTFFRVVPPARPDAVVEQLRQAGISVEPAGLPRAYHLVSGSVSEALSVAKDCLAFLDINSQRVAAALDVRPGSSVLDVCAAPGGKARTLAENAPVVAGDRRMGRIRTMLRIGSQNLRPLVLDAERALPFSARFDRVLVDAPCTGTGTLARNPEIKWRLSPEDLDDLSARQTRILRNASDALAPGGILVYATCSLEPEENEAVVESVVGGCRDWSASKAFSTVPGSDPGDGFQAFLIRRHGA